MAFDLFDRLAIRPIKLSLDRSNLEKTFYELSKNFHPDLNQGRLEAVELTAALNEAYRILKNPWNRAEYFFSELGGALGKKIPAKLAQEYFELQELENGEGLKELSERLQNRLSEQDRDLITLFTTIDTIEFSALNPAHPAVVQLHDLILERNYTNSMLRDITARLEKMNHGKHE